MTSPDTSGSQSRSFCALPSLLLAFLLAVFAPLAAKAHGYNESYIYFDVGEDSLGGRLEVTLNDLARLLAQDAAVTEPISQETAIAEQETIFGYFEERINLQHEGTRYSVDFTGMDFMGTEVGVFALMHFDVSGMAAPPLTLDMSYDGLFRDIDPSHRGYALVASNERTGMEENESYISLVFVRGDGPQTLYLDDERSADIAWRFVEHGVWHIWLGFDHVLFLVTLLLSAVMYINGTRWEPAQNLSQCFWKTVKIVTVFTVAHTVTLSLATFGIVTLPPVFVEAVIAVSIAVVALGNLFPRLHAQSWMIVFIFGLFHGFGFANVLEPLGLDPARKALGLAAFNIGVELGQLAIVVVLFPLLFALRKLTAYRLVGMQAGSVALIAIAIFWFVERTAGTFWPVAEAMAGVTG